MAHTRIGIAFLPALWLAGAPGFAGDLPFRFGEFETTVTDVGRPAAVDIDDEGRVYIVDGLRARVVVTDRDGAVREVWGTYGTGPGEFESPSGVDVAGDEVFVADGGNNRIQVFDRAGGFLRQWGTRGRGPDELCHPAGVAATVDRVYVADVGNDRIQVYDRAGAFVMTIGGPGTDPGLLRRPLDVDVADDGRLYVADADNNRIQCFGSDGAFVRAWGDWGPFRGLMDEPGSLVCRDDRVFVADTRNHRVQVFDADGAELYQWGTHAVALHEGDGKIHYPDCLAIAPSGAFSVVGEGFERRVQVFAVAAADVDEAAAAGRWQSRPEQTHFGRRLAISDNVLVITEPELHKLDVFRIEHEVPILISALGGRGRAFHQFTRTGDVDLRLDPIDLYVSDTATDRVQRFALDIDVAGPLRYQPYRSRLVQAFDLPARLRATSDSSPAWTPRPDAVVRRDGRVHVVDTRNAMVHVFDDRFAWVTSWGSDVLIRPTDLAFSRDGATAYVVDAGRCLVQTFDREGRAGPSFGEHGDEVGRMIEPFGIAAGRDGFVYVTDAGRDRILVFTEDGDFVDEWGAGGSGDGAFFRPGGIAQAGDLRLFVIDQGNHRAQIFSPEGEWLVTFGTGKSSTRSQKRTRGAGN